MQVVFCAIGGKLRLVLGDLTEDFPFPLTGGGIELRNTTSGGEVPIGDHSFKAFLGEDTLDTKTLTTFSAASAASDFETSPTIFVRKSGQEMSC